MHCPISFIPLSDLEHPVVFRKQKALVVYDAEHIIIWLQTSRRNPTTNEILSPFTPLKDILVPYRLPHTTDEQWQKTQSLLLEKECVLEAVCIYISALWIRVLNWLYPIFDLLFTPLVAALSLLMTMGVIAAFTDFMFQNSVCRFTAIKAKAGPEFHWLVVFLEEIVRGNSLVILTMNQIYARFLHPHVAFILEVYFGSNCVTRYWCEGLRLIRQSAMYHNATSHTMGVDFLLDACK